MNELGSHCCCLLFFLKYYRQECLLSRGGMRGFEVKCFDMIMPFCCGSSHNLITIIVALFFVRCSRTPAVVCSDFCVLNIPIALERKCYFEHFLGIRCGICVWSRFHAFSVDSALKLPWGCLTFSVNAQIMFAGHLLLPWIFHEMALHWACCLLFRRVEGVERK